MNYNELLETYELAVGNEIEIDTAVYANLNISPRTGVHLPRPSRWSGLWPRWNVPIRIVGLMIRLLWIIGGAAFFFTLQATLMAQYLRRRGSHVQNFQHNGSFLLAFSLRASEIIPGIVCDARLHQVSFPWEPLPGNVGSLDICDLLCLRDITIAAKSAIRSVYRIAFGSNGVWVLQTYTAFKWFCARIALDKLDGDFYIAEHYDRWAVLADSSIAHQNKIRVRTGEPVRALHLVQHGTLGSLSKNVNATFPLALPYRLRYVRNLWVYDDDSLNIFRDHVLAKPILEKTPMIHYFSPSINTYNMGSNDRFSILFVGHPASEKIQAYLYNRLNRAYRVQVFYKPHPRHPAGRLALSQDWKIIEVHDIFPLVDLVIAYPSTLVIEYKAIDVEAFVHPINPVPDIFEELWLKLDTVLDMKVSRHT